jgi:hypothetical protein
MDKEPEYKWVPRPDLFPDVVLDKAARDAVMAAVDEHVLGLMTKGFGPVAGSMGLLNDRSDEADDSR